MKMYQKFAFIIMFSLFFTACSASETVENQEQYDLNYNQDYSNGDDKLSYYDSLPNADDYFEKRKYIDGLNGEYLISSGSLDGDLPSQRFIDGKREEKGLIVREVENNNEDKRVRELPGRVIGSKDGSEVSYLAMADSRINRSLPVKKSKDEQKTEGYLQAFGQNADRNEGYLNAVGDNPVVNRGYTSARSTVNSTKDSGEGYIQSFGNSADSEGYLANVSADRIGNGYIETFGNNESGSGYLQSFGNNSAEGGYIERLGDANQNSSGYIDRVGGVNRNEGYVDRFGNSSSDRGYLQNFGNISGSDGYIENFASTNNQNYLESINSGFAYGAENDRNRGYVESFPGSSGYRSITPTGGVVGYSVGYIESLSE